MLTEFIFLFGWLSFGSGSRMIFDSFSENLNMRDLASGSDGNYVAGTNCTACTEGTYRNEAGGENTQFNIYSETYDPSTDSQDCFNAVPDNSYINLTAQINENIVINDMSTSSPNVGEWKFVVDTSSKVTIIIDRTSYETMVMNTTSTTGNNSGYDNSDLYDGQSSDFELSYEGIEYVTIRVKKLDDRSNYTINLSQSGTVEPTTSSDAGKYDPLLFGVMGVILCGLFGLLGTTLSLIGFKRNQTKHKYKNYYSKQNNQNSIRVNATLKNMKHGTCEQMFTGDVECELGNEIIDKQSEIHVHTSGDNVFHSRGLEHWFLMIHPKVDLHCPVGHQSIDNEESISNEDNKDQRNTSYEFPKTEIRMRFNELN